MEYRNTTDIPNRLIEIAVAFSIQDGVNVEEIVIKNKTADILHGKFGWYHPVDEKIVLVVPPVMAKPITHLMGYSGLKCHFESRSDFVVAVMAHELRHAWQWQAAGNQAYKLSKALRERDAEQYEYGILAKWKAMTGRIERDSAAVQPQPVGTLSNPRGWMRIA